MSISSPVLNGQSSIQVRLRSISYAARDTHLYEFCRPEGGVLPASTPGAHIDLHLPNGMTRSYSLVHSGANPSSYVVGIKLDPKSRGGSRYIHEELRVGAQLSVSTPRNHFPLIETAGYSVLIAGGIGITPIWCMVQRLQSLGRSWELWYSCRSRADVAFLEDLSAFGSLVHCHIDDEDGGVMDMASAIKAAPKGAHIYCCGPTPMLAAYDVATVELPRETVHLEHFGATQASATEGGYIIELAHTGREFAVPKGKSILHVLAESGIVVSSSCEQGVCGACEVGVLAGEVDHRDAILTPSERASNTTMMICCSGAKSARLLLDL